MASRRFSVSVVHVGPGSKLHPNGNGILVPEQMKTVEEDSTLIMASVNLSIICFFTNEISHLY
uniref:Uncharacterized protein n=1 Tax=Helianthus annuus TaxID=4232 RepID=A0A251U9M1_HELAN